MRPRVKSEKWEPFQELDRLLTYMPGFLGDARVEHEWMPTTDIMETKTSYLVRAELPGIDEEDIHIRVEGRILSIEGEKKFEKKTDEENYHRIESSYGRFFRSFTLPDSIDPEKVKAAFEKGVLKVEVPKTEGAKPKEIRIGKNKKEIAAA